MPRFVVLLLLWLLPAGLRAQHPARLPAGLLNPDSQRVWVVRPPTADTVRLNYFIDEALRHINTNLDSARSLSESAVALAWRRGQGKALVYGLNYAATVYYYSSDYPAAQRAYTLLLWAARRAARPEMVAAAYMGQGNVARDLNNYAGAERYFRQAQQAYAAQRPPSRQGQLAVLGNRAYNALDRDSLPQARRLVRQALALLRQLPQARHPAAYRMQQGLVYKQSQLYDSAALAFEEAVRVARATHDPSPEAESRQELAGLALRRADYAAALRQARLAETLFRDRGDPQQQADALKQQADALAGLRRPEAYATLRRYLVLYDSSLARQRAEAVVTAQARFDRAGQEARIAGLEKDRRIQALEAERRATRTRLLGTGGALAASLLLGGIVLGYRRQQKAREAALRHQLAADLHDDLGPLLTQLAVESSLLRETVFTPEQLLARLQRLGHTSQQAAQHLGDVLRDLDQGPAAAAPAPVGELVAQLREQAHESLSPHELSLLFTPLAPALAERLLPAVTRHALALIFREALHNVVKHAAGATLVQATLEAETDGLRLTLRDDGQAPADTLRPGGRGLRNMRTRAEALGGRCEAGPAPGGGYQVRCWLPS
ncbi:histidine kinase [Hymenobacter sp. ASUV-10]|uniref:histidine kinase n=1 Tax=Hymenobacter aranciens TaxID=3063996 RepID=A0ABT9B6H2_9BACT|nr:ATP-binding protein [Hymenobacter sp. ASUV-10]MDO7873815.1 histidine kinase [Hymenobacter sp. ASUV-10]